MSIRLLPALALAMLLTGCVSLKLDPMSTRTVNFGVSLEPETGLMPSGIKVRSKPQGWQRGNKKDGYVGYSRGESGFTTFSIRNEVAGARCGDTENPADWVITKLELASQGNATTEKGSNFGQPQSKWLKKAFPRVNMKNGELFNVNDKADGRTTLFAYNANAQKGYRLIYYRVTMTRCSDGHVIETDPAWGNGGRR